MNLLRALALMGAAAVMMCSAPLAGTSSPTPAHNNRAYLGVQVGDVNSSGGAVVLSVAPGAPAESAGVQVGDVIKGVNGHTVANASAVEAAIASMTPGSTASLRVDRNGHTVVVDVRLGTPPAT